MRGGNGSAESGGAETAARKRQSREGKASAFASIAGRAVVTGATGGIGNGIARVFASNGARVLIAATDGEAAGATARELGDCAPEDADVSYLLADVSQREDCKKRMAGRCCQRRPVPWTRADDR